MKGAAAALFAAVWLALCAAPAAASDLSRMAPMIDVQGLIDGDVTLAGGRIAVEAEIAGDLVATGASIGIGAATSVKRNVFLFGGEIAMAGRYAQRVWAAGGEVVLDIAAAGDVSVAAGHVVIGPNTRIAGKLRVWSPDPPLVHASAEIAGGVVYAPGDMANAVDALLGYVGAILRWGFTLAVWATALLLAAFAPGFLAACAAAIAARTGAVLLWGLCLVFGLPFVILLSAVTLVGLPLAGALILALGFGLGVGYAIAAAALGNAGLGLFGRRENPGLLWRLAAVLAGLVALAALRHIPVAGTVVLAAAFVFGLGAASREINRRMR
ncbi:MAG: hypothetical protein ING44_01420 [Telmatospirillum sp.]|nr:hypothetical protein [Telmatospirillum sp.]